MPTLARTTRRRPASATGARSASITRSGDALGLLRAGDVLEQDGELVAAQPRHRVAGAQDLVDPPGDERAAARRPPRGRASR